MVPQNAGVLSAFGLLAADFTQYEAVTRRLGVGPGAAAAVRLQVDELHARLAQRFGQLGMRTALQRSASLQMRFVGQAFEIDVPLTDADLALLDEALLGEHFDRAHRLVYMDSGGAGLGGKAIEVVGFRVGASAPAAPVLPPKPAARAGVSTRVRMTENREVRDCVVTTRPALDAVGAADGPLLIEDETATIYVPPGWTARCDAAGNLILKRKDGSA